MEFEIKSLFSFIFGNIFLSFVIYVDGLKAAPSLFDEQYEKNIFSSAIVKDL